MSAWGDSELLVELLDRQFKFLLDLRGTAQIIRLPRVLSFLQSEPQLAAILEDLRAEATSELERYNIADATVRAELNRIWESHALELHHRLAAVKDDALNAYSSIERFEQALVEMRSASFTEREGIEKITENLVRSLQHWWKWTSDISKKNNAPLEGDYASLGKRLSRTEAIHRFAVRRLHEKKRGLAWPAYERLVEHAVVTNPEPPALDDDVAWITFKMASDFAESVALADEGHADDADEFDIDDMYGEIRRDTALLHEELRFRVGQARSRAALVNRYAARCEAFEAERLRTHCEGESRRAEHLLTLDLARYLFDAGLRPLIDANVGGLRPDVLHLVPSSLFYVEAKQYANDHPRSQLTKAYAQVWSTWGRLRKTYPTSEAFLVVFRRSGPWVDLPSVIHHQGLRLYSVVADISTEAGSKEKSSPIRLVEDELRPKEQA